MVGKRGVLEENAVVGRRRRRCAKRRKSEKEFKKEKGKKNGRNGLKREVEAG